MVSKNVAKKKLMIIFKLSFRFVIDRTYNIKRIYS